MGDGDPLTGASQWRGDPAYCRAESEGTPGMGRRWRRSPGLRGHGRRGEGEGMCMQALVSPRFVYFFMVPKETTVTEPSARAAL